MRNISFQLTEPQFIDGSKDVTRRLGWLRLKPGDRLMACRKCMGLRRGEQITRLGPIEIVDVRREPLRRMLDDPTYGRAEAAREGFPELSGSEFVGMFCLHMSCPSSTIITRIQFRKMDHRGGGAAAPR